MNKHEFDDIIKQRAQQREADVPDDLWEGINKERKKRRRFPFFWLTLIILLLGSGAVVWNINKKDKAVEIASKEITTKKNDQINKNESIKKIDNRTTVAPLLSNDDKKDNAAAINSTNTADEKNNYHANEATTISNKKDNSLITTAHSGYEQKDNDQNKEKLFVSDKNKRNTKANTKVKTITGESENLIDHIPGKEKIFSAINNLDDSKGKEKINISEAETGTTLTDTEKNDNDKIVSNKKELFPVNPGMDSLLTKKVSTFIADSPENKKTIAIHDLKKTKDKDKNSRLKIEAGITVVSPIQNYKQPLYIRRVLDHTNIHSEFISDKIKTSVEPGIGYNISLVKNLNKKWSIGGGIQYLRFTEHLQMSGIETNTDYKIVKRLVTDQGVSFLQSDTVKAITKDMTTLDGRNIYHSLSIPLFLRYQLFSTKKWSAAITGGAYIDLLRKYHTSTPGKFETVYTYGTESAESKNTIGIDLFAGLHVERRFSKKYALFATPEFRYNLSAYKTNNLSFNKKIHKPTVSIGIARYL